MQDECISYLECDVFIYTTNLSINGMAYLVSFGIGIFTVFVSGKGDVECFT